MSAQNTVRAAKSSDRSAARNEADVVIVTVTADRFVNKGPGRPIFPENMRAEMLAALGTVDWVGINQTSSAEPILDTVRPDIYVKGSDYRGRHRGGDQRGDCR